MRAFIALYGARVTDLASVSLLALLFLEALSFGGERVDIALAFSGLYGLLLALFLLHPEMRRRLRRLDGLLTAGSLFLLALVGVALSASPLLGPRALFAGGRLVRIAAAGEPVLTAVEVVKLLGGACAFLLAALISQETAAGGRLIRRLTLLGALFCGASILLELFSPGAVFGAPKPLIARGRLSAAFSSPNIAGTLFAVLAVLATGGVLRAVSRLSRRRLKNQIPELLIRARIEIPAFVLAVLSLLLSGSRGALAAFGVAFLLLLVWRARRVRTAPLFWVVTLGLLLLLLVVFGDLSAARILGAHYDQDLRLAWNRKSLELFAANPVAGVGLGSFAQAFTQGATPSDWKVLDWAGSAHNVYLQWLVEGGLIASVPMGALLLFLLWKAAAPVLAAPRPSAYALAAAASIVLILLHSLVDYGLQAPSICVLFEILLGWLVGSASAPDRGGAAVGGSRRRGR